MTTTDRDVADHHAAGALADELPYWGWLPDDRTCLTRRGELVTTRNPCNSTVALTKLSTSMSLLSDTQVVSQLLST